MAGQMRDIMLDTLKHRASTLPWNMWKEDEQQDFIDRVNAVVEEATKQAVEIICADGRPTIACNVEQFTVKDGVKIVVKTTLSPETLAIIGTLKTKTAILTFADAGDYMGMTFRGPEPLQPELFENGEDGAPVFDKTTAGKRTRRKKGQEPEAQPEA
jgi:hypothetical protein